MLTLSCKHVFKLYTQNVASESFLAVATMTNVEQSSADYTVNADAVQLLESVKALNQQFEEEEFNLEALRQIMDAISMPPVMNSTNTGHETASIASSKRGKGKGRNSKKATREQQHHHHQQQQQQRKECAAVPDNTSLLFQTVEWLQNTYLRKQWILFRTITYYPFNICL